MVLLPDSLVPPLTRASLDVRAAHPLVAPARDALSLSCRPGLPRDGGRPATVAAASCSRDRDPARRPPRRSARRGRGTGDVSRVSSQLRGAPAGGRQRHPDRTDCSGTRTWARRWPTRASCIGMVAAW